MSELPSPFRDVDASAAAAVQDARLALVRLLDYAVAHCSALTDESPISVSALKAIGALDAAFRAPALEVADTRQDGGGLSGSRASTEPEGGLGPPGFDPGREWQPIETAPKDGTIFLAYWHDDPQFVAWVGDVDGEVKYRRVGPFWNRRTEKTVVSRETGFRVLMPPSRGRGFNVHGNFAPFTPTHWMPLPEPPASAIEAGTVETEGLDAKHESAVAKPDAQEPRHD